MLVTVRRGVPRGGTNPERRIPAPVPHQTNKLVHIAGSGAVMECDRYLVEARMRLAAVRARRVDAIRAGANRGA